MPLESINQNYIYRRMINNTIIVNINCASISIFELEDLLKDIDILRKQLNELINKKQGNLVVPEVVTASKVFNASLNQYNKFIDKKLKKNS